MPAARLAELGVFEPAPLFHPDDAVTVIDAIRGIFMTAEQKVGGLSDGELVSLAKRSYLMEEGIFQSVTDTITVSQLCYLADRACVDHPNALQYSMAVPAYDSLPGVFQKALVQAVGLGLVEYDAYGSPGAGVTRAQLAVVLYRLRNPGARVIAPYDLGALYDPSEQEYLVKNTYTENPGGVQFGLYSNYNHQDAAYSYFGKRPVDRTDFYKWALIEKSPGVYTMPSFENDAAAHRAGSTVICNVDVSANYNVNSQLSGGSRIPAFYTQDIKDPATRRAAKNFLRQFVTSLLNAVHGDVMLAIDYEIDYQQGITGSGQAQKDKAAAFADWYVEAAAVAREAANGAGAGGRLKIICIYNNITKMHLLGKGQNQWMLRVSGASDVIGLDTYQFDSTDPSNPNITLQNIRYLMQNFSLGKPVFVVENGMDGNPDDAQSLACQEMYWKRLFREFRFALEKGDFLNGRLSGFLAWSLFDTSASTCKGLLTVNGREPKPALAAVQEGIKALEKQRQFHPSVLTGTAAADPNTPVRVQSGVSYDTLALVTKNTYPNRTATLRVELEEEGTVMVTVNGKTHFSSMDASKFHFITLENAMGTDLTVLELYFGASRTPFAQTVKSVALLSS